MKTKTSVPFALVTAVVFAMNLAHADVTLFRDRFESGDLSQWTGKDGGAHHGQIVTDPLNPANHVLTFTGVNAAGDIFSAARLEFSGPRRYILSFDFLGRSTGPTPDEFGGFIGISASPAADPVQFWLAGTYLPALNAPAPVATQLVADGQWHHYAIDITPVVLAAQLTGTHLMLEDWNDRGSVAGDVYFDNVRLVGVLDAQVFEDAVPCSGPAPGVRWKNHGQYVSSMSKVVEAYLLAGFITDAEAEALVSCAARSDCGKKTSR